MENRKPWHEDDAYWETFGPMMFAPHRWEMAPGEVEQLIALTGIEAGFDRKDKYDCYGMIDVGRRIHILPPLLTVLAGCECECSDEVRKCFLIQVPCAPHSNRGRSPWLVALNI